jgi:hypothetical protein
MTISLTLESDTDSSNRRANIFPPLLLLLFGQVGGRERTPLLSP